jgi:predicted NBD/HSP70 family sugar kinase
MAAERSDSARTSRPRARAAVLQTLIEAGAVSRAELARRTGLAPSTVSAVVADLAADGVLVEAARAASAEGGSAVGRPSTLLALHRRAGLAVGIDFGKRHVRVAVADLAHTVVAERRREVEGDLPAAEAVAIGAELTEAALADAAAAPREVVGVGMGLPGPINEATGELGDSMILPGWAGVRPAEVMSSALGQPVAVGNDANLGAMSEWRWGAGQGARDLVYVKVATGVGAGMILGGVPYRGWGGTAGELGHVVIEPRGSICRCGNRGCLETIAGAPAILAALRDAHGEGLTTADAVRRATGGDAGCCRAIADAGAAIGTAAAAICNLLNPRRIVVGGDVAAAGEVLLGPLREALARAAIRSAARDAEVVEGALGDRAEVLGAVALVLQRGADLVPAPLAREA